MGDVSTKVVKKTQAAKTSRFPKKKPIPAPPPPVELSVPRDRKIPHPLRSPAKTTMRIILEHAYWLGDALQDGDRARAQREINALARYARHYRTFAGNPNNQKIKYSSDVENYGKNAKKAKAGPAGDNVPSEDADLADLD